MDVLYTFYPEITAFLFIALTLYSCPFLGVCILTVIVSYYVTRLVWGLDTTFILTMLIRSLRPAQISTDYSGVSRELAVIKDKIKGNYILSWTRLIRLYDLSEYSLEFTADVAIERLSYLLSMKRIQVCDVISDLLKAATSHVAACRSVKYGNGTYCTTSAITAELRANLLSAYTAEWDDIHQCRPQQHLSHLTNQILRTLVPEEKRNRLSCSLLSGILSENVLRALLDYVCEQRNLLKIIILVLSDDSDLILKSAEINPSVKVVPDIRVNSFMENDNLDGAKLSPELPTYPAGDEARSLDITPPSDGLPRRQSSPEMLSHSSDDESDYKPVLSDNSHQSSDDTPDNSAEHSEQFVSSDLNKFLKLAPSTPIKEMPPIGQQLRESERSSLYSPVLQPAVMLADSTDLVTGIDSTSNDNDSPVHFSDIEGSSVPAMLLQPAAVMRPNTLGEDSKQDRDAVETVSSDSGLSTDMFVSQQLENNSEAQPDALPDPENIVGPELAQKFLSIAIQNTERRTERRQSRASYTLYVVLYQAVYVDEWGEKAVKARKVYRRWREFVNLAARLDKSLPKRLRRIDGPKWWQQISLRSLKHGDIEKRKRQLSIFLRQLIADPVFNANKDVEEFLAYNGGGEIEFVQEKGEFIPPAARLDKMVFRTVSGVVGKVTEKLAPTTTIHHGGSADHSNMELGNHVKRLHHTNQVNVPQIAVSEHYQPAGLLHTGENDLPTTIKRTPPEYLSASKWEQSLHSRVNHSATFQTLASDVAGIFIYLLCPHQNAYKHEQLTSVTYSILLPILELWLKKKITQYTQPDQLAKFLRLFHETLWPNEEEVTPTYDLEKLRSLAVDTIITEVPSLAVMVIGKDVRNLLDEILSITAHTEVNRQLIYCLLDHLLCNSCSVFAHKS